MKITLFGNPSEVQALIQYLDNCGVQRGLAHYTVMRGGTRCEVDAYPPMVSKKYANTIGGRYVQVGKDSWVPVEG
jgi:hypothetical protein